MNRRRRITWNCRFIWMLLVHYGAEDGEHGADQWDGRCLLLLPLMNEAGFTANFRNNIDPSGTVRTSDDVSMMEDGPLQGFPTQTFLGGPPRYIWGTHSNILLPFERRRPSANVSRILASPELSEL